ncbi:MAG: Ig-like domain-containing protein [Eubacterium sp.]|nr:Ig-like domain-containing protein [Eubacterium sp.]
MKKNKLFLLLLILSLIVPVGLPATTVKAETEYTYTQDGVEYLIHEYDDGSRSIQWYQSTDQFQGTLYVFVTATGEGYVTYTPDNGVAYTISLDDLMAMYPDMSLSPSASPSPSPTPTAASPAISSKSIELKVKKTKTLSVKNYTGKIKWSSSNKKVATVSQKGKVKAKKAGTAVIKAKCTTISKTFTCKVKVCKKYTQAMVRKKILSFKKKYPEGKSWTNSKYYLWKVIYTRCYGCVALVGRISDKIFGKKTKVKRHHSFAKIKSGDHVRIGNYHSVMVLKKKGNTLTVVEGNYNSSVHWGRKIKKSELQADGFYVETRY